MIRAAIEHPENGAALLTPKEVAARLALSVDAVRDLIRDRSLSAVLVSRSARSAKPRFRVSPEALEAFLAARAVQPRPQRQPRRPAYVRHV